jgi:hypothetical protein
MDHHVLSHKLGLKKYIGLIREANAEAGRPPHAHAESGEERKQCAECQAWDRNFEAIWLRVFAPYEDEGETQPEK